MARKQWQQKERKDAKLFGSKGTPRSGGLWFAKGDSKSEKFLIENKTTAKERFSITSQVWEKIKKEAVIEGRTPILSIEFAGSTLAKKHAIIVIDLNDFLEML